MILPPRQLFFRLVLWSAILVWAVWKMRQHSVNDIFGIAPPPESAAETVAAPDPVALPSPAPRALPAGEAPATVDIEAAIAAMDATETAAQACGGVGTLIVELDATGLAQATFSPDPKDPAQITCLAAAVWGRTWPRTTQGFEMVRPVAP
jgi:hypothetical protein